MLTTYTNRKPYIRRICTNISVIYGLGKTFNLVHYGWRNQKSVGHPQRRKYLHRKCGKKDIDISKDNLQLNLNSRRLYGIKKIIIQWLQPLEKFANTYRKYASLSLPYGNNVWEGPRNFAVMRPIFRSSSHLQENTLCVKPNTRKWPSTVCILPQCVGKNVTAA